MREDNAIQNAFEIHAFVNSFFFYFIFNKMDLRLCAALFGLVFSLTTSVQMIEASAKRCARVPRILDRIPVHSRFKIDKFLGTWYTIIQASDNLADDVSFESASMDFSKNSDGSLSYSVTGKVGNDPCLPVETGTMRRARRPGHYTMQGTSLTDDDPTFIVSFTNYKVALVYYCLRYRKNRLGQCQKGGMHAEIISRTENPDNKILAEYLRRIKKRLCVKPEWIKETTPGLCKIPDILEEAKVDQAEETETGVSSQCAVNSIAVQKTFSMAEMDGIWFEISRTRFTFNQMESVISAHKYVAATKEIHSYYTGTMNGTCLTAIQGMSKRRDENEPEGDMLGRIGGPESVYPWAPMKVLYADDKYLLFYACYSGATDTPCAPNFLEATLVGRSRDIDPDLQTKIYHTLTDVCLNPTDMKPTQFEANCSKWVELEIRNVGLHSSDCPIDSITNRTEFDIFDNSQMEGIWYGYSGKDFGSQGTLLGIVMNISILSNDAFFASVVGYTSGTSANCSLQHDVVMRERCLYSGEFMTSLPDGTWAFSNMLHMDDNILVYYTCKDRNIRGTCEPSEYSVYVFTRNGSVSEEIQERVDQTLRDACINPLELIRIDGDLCDESSVNDPPTLSEESNECDIDNIMLYDDLDDFKHLKLQGYWFSIGSIHGVTGDEMQAGVAFFTSDENNVLQSYTIEYVGSGENGTCTPVNHMFAIPRCTKTVNGDYLSRTDIEVANYTLGYTPYKVIFTDYDQTLLTYSCKNVTLDGTCAFGAADIMIWSRNVTLDEYLLSYVKDWIPWDCLSSDTVLETSHEKSCFAELKSYLAENEVTYADDESGETETEEDIMDVEGEIID